MKTTKKNPRRKRGSVLVLVTVSLTILTILGAGLLTVSYTVRRRAAVIKNEAVAMLAAEAGYEKALFWMSQQPDLLNVLSQDNLPGGSIHFADGSCDYTIGFYSYIGCRPVFRVVSNGHAGSANRTCDVLIFQAIGGWESTHQVPNGASSTMSWPFASGEIIDIPVHVNKHDDNPDTRDIYITGNPDFRQPVSFGESRYDPAGTDKYADVISLFGEGVYFNQPDSKISNTTAVQQKIDRFRDSTDSSFKFTPVATAPVTKPNAAVQLEFFVEGGVGKVRITNNCTVRGYRYEDNPGPNPTFDYKLSDSSATDPYTKYDIYGYHVKPTSESPVTIPITDTYVTQSFGGIDSEAGGQIFVDGNVVIGGDNSLHDNNQKIKGKITVVATGNIWIADGIKVDGDRDGLLPAANNPNILGLIAQGVIKVVDPGMPENSYVDGGTPLYYDDTDPRVADPTAFEYVPIALPDGSANYSRKLPGTMEVEAAITVGGGGWGAENVGNRKNTNKTWYGSPTYDRLVVRGTISEAMRGIVGCAQPLWSNPPKNGYMKNYYFDQRLLQGVLPGDIWMKGKYIPAPAGWSDYRSGST